MVVYCGLWFASLVANSTLGTIANGKTAFADIVARGLYFLSNNKAREMFISNPHQLEEYIIAPHYQLLYNANIGTKASFSKARQWGDIYLPIIKPVLLILHRRGD